MRLGNSAKLEVDVLSWFKGSKAREVATAIHQVFSAAQHARTTLGPSAMIAFFSNHPHLHSHESGGMHVFKFNGMLEGLAFMVQNNPAVSERSPMKVVGFNERFAGLDIETDYLNGTEEGEYRIKLSEPMRQPMGKLVRPVARELIKAGLAYDVVARVQSFREGKW